VYTKVVSSDFNGNSNMRFELSIEAAYREYALPCTYLYTRKLKIRTIVIAYV
jgi:hypothetical protein